jgi:hypothetical protein
MATFSNLKAKNVGTTVVTLTSAIQPTVIAGCNMANITGSTNSISLYVQSGSDIYYIVKGKSVDGGNSYDAITGNKIFLESGDALKAVAGTEDAFDIVVSILDGI